MQLLSIAAAASVPGAFPRDAVFDQACGQSQASATNVDSLLLLIQIRSFRENCNQINALIILHHRTHFVTLTETWFTKASESIRLTGIAWYLE